MESRRYNFNLPDELIARYPLGVRGQSRLLEVGQHSAQDRSFAEFSKLLHPNDLIIFNNTAVIPARLMGHKSSGGKLEALIERITSPNQAWAHIKTSKKLSVGADVIFEPQGTRAQVLESKAGLYLLNFLEVDSVYALLDKIGTIPLPPYLKRQTEALDWERYQTVYASEKGAVAAPTAGLHFDESTMDHLKAHFDLAYVTLHVGAGTFMPLRTDVENHVMHSEVYSVSEDVCHKIEAAKARGGRVVAIGTTSLRALESAAAGGGLKPSRGETQLFIKPGFKFQVVDALLTNFHLPNSTLLMLVCAFGGEAPMLKAYQEAIERAYRFYSYGDAMFINRAPSF